MKQRATKYVPRRAGDLRPAPYLGVANGLKATMMALVGSEIGMSISKAKQVSGLTRMQRASTISLIADQIHEGGFRIKTVGQIKGRHVAYLFKRWHLEGIAIATMQNRRTVLKWVCDLAGKAGMVHELADYLPDGDVTRRNLCAIKDRAWDAAGVDAVSVISSIKGPHPWAAALLDLIRTFGLRRAEAVCLRPRIALVERRGIQVVWIRSCGWGSKGGRERFIPVVSQDQLEAISYAASFCKRDEDAVMRGMGLSKKQAIEKFKRICERSEITKKGLGVTLHGLRHQYYHERILAVDGGMESPVKLIDDLTVIQSILELRQHDREDELRRALERVRASRWGFFDVDDLDEIERLNQARLQVSQELGHGRLAITNAYAGSYAKLISLLRSLRSVIDAPDGASFDDLVSRLRATAKPVRNELVDDGEEGDWDD